MSDLPFHDYATELSQLAVTEDPPFYNGSCLGCLANEPDQLSHMGLGGCLADDYDDYYNNTAPLEPMSDEQLAILYDSVVPEDVQFYINGYLIPPGTAVTDALSALSGTYNDDFFNLDNYHYTDDDAEDDDNYHYNTTALLEPLSDLAAFQNLDVPDGVKYYNGHPILPDMAVTDAMSAFGEGEDDYCDDDDECYGCQMDSMSRADHTGVNGCLTDMGGCC